MCLRLLDMRPVDDEWLDSEWWCVDVALRGVEVRLPRGGGEKKDPDDRPLSEDLRLAGGVRFLAGTVIHSPESSCVVDQGASLV